MNSTPTMQVAEVTGNQLAKAALQPDVQHAERSLGATVKVTPRRAGYGLPCVKCKTYYAADLTVCPVCKGTERVSPTAAAAPLSAGLSEQLPDDAALEEERERFLREFKAQVYASHTQINAAASFRCSLEENHAEAFEPASVCQSCYDHLQERADVMEAALHMDIKEAAQVIYDAVWSDPSDPTKTYQNAAQALLGELRKRAGIALVLGPLQPKPH
jgi:hypothetical protein